MTIGIDAHPLLESRGGVAEYTRHLITAMISRAPQHEYVLYTSGSCRPSVLESIVPTHASCQVVHVSIPNKFLNASMVFIGRPQLDRLIEMRSGRRLDCLWCPNGNFVPLSGRTPLVITFHDASFAIEASWFSRRQRLWHRLVNFPKLVGGAAAIIAVSEKTKEDLRTFFCVQSQRVTVIGLGTAEPDANSGDELVRDLPKKFILSFGAENPRKNAECLVDAVYRMRSLYPSLRDVRLVLVQTENASLRRLKHLIRLRGLQGFCLIRGPLSSSLRSAFISRASLLAYPSLYEGFGLPPFEAARFGVPSIVSSVASLPETSGDFSLLVNPYDSTSVARGLGTLLLDQRVRQRAIARGRDALNSFTWDAAAAATISLFERTQSHSRI